MLIFHRSIHISASVAGPDYASSQMGLTFCFGRRQCAPLDTLEAPVVDLGYVKYRGKHNPAVGYVKKSNQPSFPSTNLLTSTDQNSDLSRH